MEATERREGQPSGADTIFAPATAPGRAAVAIVRLSGPGAVAALRRLAGEPPPPRLMSLRTLRGADGAAFDQAMAVHFPAGRSYSGEDMVELHVHGGRATLARTLAELAAMPGLRAAEPGEFTRRSLRNGVMDLVQAEGLAELIDAETEMQRRQALAVLEGGASERVRLWRDAVLDALGLVEATLDFADEADAPETPDAGLPARLYALAAEIGEVAGGAPGRERLRDGFRVALVGPPNAGKSTLLNAIAGEEAAIASPTPGTTRDVIRVVCDLGGLPVMFLDMAGLRETSDPVEALGVDRARGAAAEADLRLFLAASDAPAEGSEGLERPGDLRVWTKADLARGPGWPEVAALTGAGVAELLELVRGRLVGRASASPLAANIRQAGRLDEAAAALRSAARTQDGEIRAEELRRAARALEGVIGRVSPDEVLDGVFRRFCIGK